MATSQTQTRRIQVLPPHVVNRIAAGEVVERPASVVKELVENALDAGATRIEIFIGAGGRTIRVADNGCGMSEADARLAFYNHATSKISDVDDLDRIATLGFRGEALASVSSIARVTCLTRQTDSPGGLRVVLDELGEPSISEAGCAPGTVMEVADLFYNTPARLKFLKRPQTELGHIEESVQHLALSHPEVQFQLTLGDKDALKTSGSGDLQQTMEEVFRLRREGVSLVPVTHTDPEAGYALAGYTSTPGVMKSSKRWMVSFVNGRLVKCPMLAKALESAYESLLPHGKYPVCVVFLTLPPSEVDVNVHPTKREVRYASANTMFSFVRYGVLNSLERHGVNLYSAPPVDAAQSAETLAVSPDTASHSGQVVHPTQARKGFGGASSVGSGSRHTTGLVSPKWHRPNESHTQAALAFYNPAASPMPVTPEAAQAEDDTPSLPAFKVIGQLYNTYILIESPQGLLVVDQHIASERTFFESLSRNMLCEDGSTPDVQHLLTAVPVSLSPTQRDLLAENRERFAKLGFSYGLTEAGVELSAIPIIYQGREPKGLFESLLAQLEETGEMKLDLDHLIATLSCHSAVRAGDVLSHEDMHRVIERWLACRLPWTCPHGRPIAHTISKNELNHFFHRPSLPVSAL